MPRAADDPLAATVHRPWPLPRGPWVMAQRWHDLLFAHWPVPAAALRPLVPPALELDLWDGEAWVGVVPFRMSGVRLRGLPGFPGLAAFPELNVRTYVRVGEKRGVWFFSLDCARGLAVRVARGWFRLPYFKARMRCEPHACEATHDGNGEADWIRYASERAHPGAAPGVLEGVYGPVGPVALAQLGTLEHWLTERYCLYAVGRGGRVLRGEIHHRPWPLQPAEAELERNDVAQSHGIALPDSEPLLHFARDLDVRIWAPRSVGPVASLRCGGPRADR